jgi:hypothetical protein
MTNRFDRVVTVLLGLVAAVAPAHSQDPTRAPIARTIAAAEAEGATFPRGPAPDSSRVAALGLAGGDGRRTCLRMPFGTSDTTVRAGDFRVPHDFRAIKPGVLSRTYWRPLHEPVSTTPLVVRAAYLSATASTRTMYDTLRVIEPNTVYGGRQPTPAEIAEDPNKRRWSPYGTYLMSMIFPRSGAWLVVMTSGPDWGCVIVDMS